ncbi:MAG: TIGR02391 family protein [Phycisphaerae bacterium]
MPKRRPDSPPIESREFRSVEEIESGISKLERRIRELEQLDVRAAVLEDTGADDVVRSNVRETIRAVFGPNSPEFNEHQHIRLWAGPRRTRMHLQEIVEGTERGCRQVIGILNGLIGRLREKRDDLGGGGVPSAPSTYFDRLNLHPRILDVSRDLFLDGYHWEAVFAAAKALVNYVKERSGRHDLDGASLVRIVFSRNNPVLAFNNLSDQTDLDEQEGMMHLFEGAVLGIRNPGGHSFPEGPEQRAVEYISLLSLLAYRVQEAKRRKSSS